MHARRYFFQALDSDQLHMGGAVFDLPPVRGGGSCTGTHRRGKAGIAASGCRLR
jgi:hypothetical protein